MPSIARAPSTKRPLGEVAENFLPMSDERNRDAMRWTEWPSTILIVVEVEMSALDDFRRLNNDAIVRNSRGDKIVKSPPDLADSGPLGSCLDIRIVGFIFITLVAARRGAKRLLGRPMKFRSELWRAGHRPQNLTKENITKSTMFDHTVHHVPDVPTSQIIAPWTAHRLYIRWRSRF
eukprot:scaffold5664_cov94-Skeletonema_dohrnii-CCMP3373.AAC.8